MISLLYNILHVTLSRAQLFCCCGNVLNYLPIDKDVFNCCVVLCLVATLVFYEEVLFFLLCFVFVLLRQLNSPSVWINSSVLLPKLLCGFKIKFTFIGSYKKSIRSCLSLVFRGLALLSCRLFLQNKLLF